MFSKSLISVINVFGCFKNQRQPEKQGKTNENQLKFNDYAVCIVATAFSTLQWRRKSKVVGQLFV